MDKVSEWSLRKAVELIATANCPYDFIPSMVIEAVAAYIEQHEEPPVDPVLKRAREIFDKYHGHNHEDVFEGRWDGNCNMLAIIEALKDGKSED